MSFPNLLNPNSEPCPIATQVERNRLAILHLAKTIRRASRYQYSWLIFSGEFDQHLPESNSGSKTDDLKETISKGTPDYIFGYALQSHNLDEQKR